MIHYDYYADAPREAIDELLATATLGRLVTAGSAGMPHIGLYPFTYDGAAVEIHLHRDDEQLADLRENASSVFEVDEILGTIPSHWIHPENAVFATAYHRTVAFECVASLSDDGDTLARQQNDIMRRYQPEGGYRAVRPDDPMYARMLGLLVAVHLEITATKVKFKLGQNRSLDVRSRLVERLRERGSATDRRAADALQWTIDLGWTAKGRSRRSA